jgi:hypothetical protein
MFVGREGQNRPPGFLHRLVPAANGGIVVNARSCFPELFEPLEDVLDRRLEAGWNVSPGRVAERLTLWIQVEIVASETVFVETYFTRVAHEHESATPLDGKHFLEWSPIGLVGSGPFQDVRPSPLEGSDGDVLGFHENYVYEGIRRRSVAQTTLSLSWNEIGGALSSIAPLGVE